MVKTLLHQQWGHGPLHNAAEKIVESLFRGLVEGSAQKFSSSGTLSMLESLFIARVELKPVLIKALQEMELDELNEDTANRTLQHIIELLLPLLSQHLHQLKSGQDPTSPVHNKQGSDTSWVELCKEDKQILHFAIGYTALKFRRKFQRFCASNKAAQLYLDVVKSWTVEPENSTLTQEVQEWTLSLDRGSLLHCSAEFFQTMKVVEINPRVHLNTKTIVLYAGVNVVPIIVAKLKATTAVVDAFRHLVGK